MKQFCGRLSRICYALKELEKVVDFETLRTTCFEQFISLCHTESFFEVVFKIPIEIITVLILFKTLVKIGGITSFILCSCEVKSHIIYITNLSSFIFQCLLIADIIFAFRVWSLYKMLKDEPFITFSVNLDIVQTGIKKVLYNL